MVVKKKSRQNQYISRQRGKCPICLMSMNEKKEKREKGKRSSKKGKKKDHHNYGGGESVTLHCDHVFHKKCISKWLEYKNNCPMCRKQI